MAGLVAALGWLTGRRTGDKEWFIAYGLAHERFVWACDHQHGRVEALGRIQHKLKDGPAGDQVKWAWHARSGSYPGAPKR